MKRDLCLLDCTLRDGGYVNNWNWGYHAAREIVKCLVKARVEIVEVGFLRDTDAYRKDVTVCNTIRELNRLLPRETGHTMFSAMAMRSNYDISKLEPYSGQGIEMVRITAHDYDITEGMDFAREVKEKGYKLSINPINIMGYSDKEILWIVEQVNTIRPYQFSIVDTFGSMKRRDLDRIVSLVDNNLDRDIRLALHLHENMSLGCLLAQMFVDKHLNRPITIDGSLMGMGRTPGNLPIELIADYLNEYSDKCYNIDYMMDAIGDYIAPIKGKTEWGYTPAYFLSARFNLHRNYAEHYLAKGDLTNRDINHILAGFDRKKAGVFDGVYADRVYEEYKNHQVDDSLARKALAERLSGRAILVLAPGTSIAKYRKDVEKYITLHRPIVIAVNFVPDNYDADYAFFCNNKRFDRIEKGTCGIIATSNLPEGKADYRINYSSLCGAFSEGTNSLVMLLKLLEELGMESATLAGADGFSAEGADYYRSDIISAVRHDEKYNIAVAEAINRIALKIDFITPSAYNIWK